jgi:hypothetical protein
MLRAYTHPLTCQPLEEQSRTTPVDAQYEDDACGMGRLVPGIPRESPAIGACRRTLISKGSTAQTP